MTTQPGVMLVVDDDSMNRTLLATSLEEAGHVVETAEDGLQALEALRTKPFDVVLLDLLMPKRDGFEVLERMKADSPLQHIPVIVISALDEMESVIRCIKMGATDHLPKPFDPVLLHARINASLAAKRLHEQKVEYLQNIAHLAEAALKEQAAFIRILIHELKSPMTAAKMMADLLGASPLENSKIAHLPGRIAARMDQLLELIKDMLELARVKSGDPLGELSMLNLVSETKRGCEPYRPQAEEKGLTMYIECHEESLPVHFDSQGYQLILSNLVSNAVKYTATGFVNVTLKRQAPWAVLEVTDSGIGIPEAEISQLFKEFFRASNAKRHKIQGTGVGLAGVKHLVERFGGELALQSRENEGSTFTVRLPLYSEEPLEQLGC